ncbi:MAG: hypothetical protein WC343_09640 [Bacilli bacterium]|jgi:hypothetical protein
MTSTYTSPTTSSVDWCRDKIGDVDSAAFLLTNEEITAEITAQSNLYLAAAECAFKCIVRLGEYSALAVLFEKRGNQLLKEANRHAGFTSVTPTVGTVYDSGTQPNDYAISDEKLPDWSLNADDQPDTVRGIDT